MTLFAGLFHMAPSAIAKPCAATFKTTMTQLGRTSAQLFEAKGPPVATYDKRGPSNWMLYDLDYSKSVQYGKPARREGMFSVYQRTFYYLDASRTVVGFSLNVSHRPYRLELVKKRLPWATKLKWERVHLIRREPAPAILATAACGKFVVMLQADCYQLDAVNPKTYKRVTRDPNNVGECRFRGLFIQLRDRTKKNAQVTYTPYRFDR